MTLKIDDIKFATRLPEIPAAVSAVDVRGPSLDDRSEGMKSLTELLGIGKVRAISTEFSQVWAGPGGDVEYFHNSGGVWSRDLKASASHDNELRDWKGLQKAREGDGNTILTFDRAMTARAIDQARETAKRAGFDTEHVSGQDVSLVQVSELSEEGKTLRQGAGEATIRFSHAVDGMAVFGAGAKTMFDFDPDGDALHLVGAMQVWRTPVGTRKIKIGGTEAALAAGFLSDPDLELASKQGGQITVDELEFGLMALPATMRQEMLFPVLRVAGRVTMKEGKLGYYEFGRYCHAASPKAYAAAGIYADYLARPN